MTIPDNFWQAAIAFMFSATTLMSAMTMHLQNRNHKKMDEVKEQSNGINEKLRQTIADQSIIIRNADDATKACAAVVNGYACPVVILKGDTE